MQPSHLSNIFVGLQSRLQAVGRAILGRDDRVDDALQETFCKLWSRRDDLDHAQNLAAYTVRTMRNECLNMARRQAASPQFTELENCADTGCDSHDEADDVYSEVMQIIELQLTDLQRAVLKMRDVEGMAFDDIAETLGIEAATVRVHLSRARRAVRTIYLQRK